MMEKYKISAAAADLGVSSKEVIAVIKEYTGVEKKTGAVLAPEEVNVLFDALTQRHAVKSFKEYFATGDTAREEEEKARKNKQKMKKETNKKYLN